MTDLGSEYASPSGGFRQAAAGAQIITPRGVGGFSTPGGQDYGTPCGSRVGVESISGEDVEPEEFGTPGTIPGGSARDDIVVDDVYPASCGEEEPEILKDEVDCYMEESGSSSSDRLAPTLSREQRTASSDSATQRPIGFQKRTDAPRSLFGQKSSASVPHVVEKIDDESIDQLSSTRRDCEVMESGRTQATVEMNNQEFGFSTRQVDDVLAASTADVRFREVAASESSVHLQEAEDPNGDRRQRTYAKQEDVAVDPIEMDIYPPLRTSSSALFDLEAPEETGELAVSEEATPPLMLRGQKTLSTTSSGCDAQNEKSAVANSSTATSEDAVKNSVKDDTLDTAAKTASAELVADEGVEGEQEDALARGSASIMENNKVKATISDALGDNNDAENITDEAGADVHEDVFSSPVKATATEPAVPLLGPHAKRPSLKVNMSFATRPLLLHAAGIDSTTSDARKSLGQHRFSFNALSPLGAGPVFLHRPSWGLRNSSAATRYSSLPAYRSTSKCCPAPETEIGTSVRDDLEEELAAANQSKTISTTTSSKGATENRKSSSPSVPAALRAFSKRTEPAASSGLQDSTHSAASRSVSSSTTLQQRHEVLSRASRGRPPPVVGGSRLVVSVLPVADAQKSLGGRVLLAGGSTGIGVANTRGTLTPTSLVRTGAGVATPTSLRLGAAGSREGSLKRGVCHWHAVQRPFFSPQLLSSSTFSSLAACGGPLSQSVRSKITLAAGTPGCSRSTTRATPDGEDVGEYLDRFRKSYNDAAREERLENSAKFLFQPCVRLPTPGASGTSSRASAAGGGTSDDTTGDQVSASNQESMNYSTLTTSGLMNLVQETPRTFGVIPNQEWKKASPGAWSMSANVAGSSPEIFTASPSPLLRVQTSTSSTKQSSAEKPVDVPAVPTSTTAAAHQNVGAAAHQSSSAFLSVGGRTFTGASSSASSPADASAAAAGGGSSSTVSESYNRVSSLLIQLPSKKSITTPSGLATSCTSTLATSCMSLFPQRNHDKPLPSPSEITYPPATSGKEMVGAVSTSVSTSTTTPGGGGIGVPSSVPAVTRRVHIGDIKTRPLSSSLCRAPIQFAPLFAPRLPIVKKVSQEPSPSAATSAQAL
ncbi:unnamed protein product [Amoebophrya sp. A25]|nr:unnamed protein product [Amoebophrya sp. A25]|eukprot:GSA25T00016587001.1